MIRQLADCYNYVGLSTETTLPASLSGTFPPDSPRTGYATEGALFISAQLLSTDAVSALRKVWVLITLRASLSGTFLQTLPELRGYIYASK